ncbi:hypothetical protein BJ508DRAFT_304243 [Ascobolus immersus RN42]|uniref:Uncharacterized protein n=1 Tax=Ascobolus immersus RN42 TaxID=1160509 RepID=A0A3N4IIV7_ASCIM|nr:hypothetical protein BJ508DRAFT_304243 [Ascobolus immersus RN42]
MVRQKLTPLLRIIPLPLVVWLFPPIPLFYGINNNGNRPNNNFRKIHLYIQYNSIIRKRSTLNAHFLYIESVVRENRLTEDERWEMIERYVDGLKVKEEEAKKSGMMMAEELLPPDYDGLCSCSEVMDKEGDCDCFGAKEEELVGGTVAVADTEAAEGVIQSEDTSEVGNNEIVLAGLAKDIGLVAVSTDATKFERQVITTQSTSETVDGSMGGLGQAETRNGGEKELRNREGSRNGSRVKQEDKDKEEADDIV